MSEAEWASLPPAIRRRFSRRLAGGQTIVYAGEILEIVDEPARVGGSRRPRGLSAARCR